MKFPRKNQLPSILILVGLTVIFWTRYEVKQRVQPDNFTIGNTDFEVVWIGGKAIVEQVDFIAQEKNKVVHSVSCPTRSWANREFYLIIFDINKDGTDDIYYDGCVGKGFLSYNQTTMEMKDYYLDETPPREKRGVNNLWFQNLKIEPGEWDFFTFSPSKNWIFMGPGSTVTTFGAISVGIGLFSYFVMFMRHLRAKKESQS